MTPQNQPDGILLLDKPVGVSSFKALYPVKRAFPGRKVGHAGTLDPAASGLLVVGIGSGTRLLEFFEGMPKTYRFGLRLGVVTDTYDLEGEVLERREVSGITPEKVEAALVRFRGDLEQVPPAYSAVKIQGKRACDRMRAGESVTLVARRVRIERLERVAGAADALVLEMDCSKGTYVRTVAHDIGQALGCGAAAENIRRLAVGPFRVEEAAEEPDPARLIPLEKAVAHLPGLRLRPNWVAGLLNGNPVPAAGYAPLAGAPAFPAAADEEALCGIYSPEGRLLALGNLTSTGHFRPRKVLQAA